MIYNSDIMELTHEISNTWWSESAHRKLQTYLLSNGPIQLYSSEPLLYTLPGASIPIIYRKMSPNYGFHEFSIGRHLNSLRSVTAHFVYTYVCLTPSDQFELSPPYNFGNQSINSADILLEYVPGPTLGSLIRNCHYKWFLNIYLQLVSALEIAYQRFHFVHHDMDVNNVIIRDQDIPIIIDFEFATLTAGGDLLYIDTSYSDVGFDSPIHDPLGLLLNVMRSLEMWGNVDCFNHLVPVLQYFLRHPVPIDTIKYLDPSNLYRYVIPVDQFDYHELKRVINDKMNV